MKKKIVGSFLVLILFMQVLVPTVLGAQSVEPSEATTKASTNEEGVLSLARAVRDLAEKVGYAREVKEYKANPENYPGHVGDISTVIRVSLTGRQNTPDMYEIMQVIGKDSVQKRLEKAIR